MNIYTKYAKYLDECIANETYPMTFAEWSNQDKGEETI